MHTELPDAGVSAAADTDQAPVAEPQAGPPWHTRDAADLARTLGTSVTAGLSEVDATRRLAEYGANRVEETPEAPWWRLLLAQTRDPLIYILLAAAAVSAIQRDVTDTAVILAVVMLNTLIGFTQEFRARNAMRALARLSAPQASVVRDGKPRAVPGAGLVPGDLVLLAPGSRVPADLRLVHAHHLAIDESLLTGESEPAEKTTDPLDDMTLMPGDQRNMAFAGTAVAHGRGRGIVVRTGGATQLGALARVVRETPPATTPLQESFARFGRRVGLVILALAAVVMIVGLARELPPGDVFLIAVAMAVSAVPEALPVVLTTTFAIGARRMARRRAIVRALPAVETLGSTTVIGTDKTGTLTRNQMTVRSIWAGGRRYEVSDAPGAGPPFVGPDGPVECAGEPALLAALRTGVLASDADAGADGTPLPDPTERALLAVAERAGLSPAGLQQRHQERDVLPFESERRYMVSLRETDDGRYEHLKGAPEAVLARCTRERTAAGDVPLDRAAAGGVAARLAAEGLRVIAMAFRRATGERIAVDTLDGGFTFAGLVAMEDPLRPEAPAAVQSARTAGIRVLMITGDHADTARVIAARLGLGHDVLTGRELDAMTDDQLARALGDVNVFARVAPEHKLRIVEALDRSGEVVAVTGDGANDAPALRAAHLGIAMGQAGSDVAREAADIVLADDNFATITAAIEEGRVVFANVRKAAFFLLSTAAAEIAVILGALLLGWPLPLLAVQILWINLVTDSLQVLALAFEKGEPGLLAEPPRPRHEGALTGPLAARLAAVGALLTAGTFVTFWWTLRATGDLALARTAALTQMVVFQFYHVFNCRSLTRSAFRVPLRANPFLLVSMLAVTAAHVAGVYTPLLQRVLGTVPLSAAQWGAILAVGLAVIGWGEADKRWRARA
ncbi:MAG TPA: HAD-IC family P-type ATPase [Gemmatimonadaceae bacterium]|nr:HAD-IC family P-type ATPase [Gemmatimonadaceae bacterium]